MFKYIYSLVTKFQMYTCIATQIVGLSKQMEEFELIFLGFDFPTQTVTDTKKCELYTVQINIILIYFYDNSTNMF